MRRPPFTATAIAGPSLVDVIAAVPFLMTLPPGIDIGLQRGKAPSQICDCMLGVELVADRSYRQSFSPRAHAGARLARIAREQGLLVRALPANNVIAFSPAFILDTQTVEEIAALFARSLDSFARKIGS